MPSRRKGGDLILFSADDPQSLVNWLVETHGIQDILRLLSEQQPGGQRHPLSVPIRSVAPRKALSGALRKAVRRAESGRRRATATKKVTVRKQQSSHTYA